MSKVSATGRSSLVLALALVVTMGAPLFTTAAFAQGSRSPDEIRFMGQRMPRPRSQAWNARMESIARGTREGARTARPAAVAPPAQVNAWTTNGVPVTSSTIGQLQPAITSDEAGGAIVGWLDFRDGQPNVYCNRLDANGDFPTGWSANALGAIVSDSFHVFCEVQPDKAGGAFLGTSIFHSGATSFFDVYVQRVLAGGTIAGGWPTTGKSMGVGSHNGFIILADGTGGAFVGWLDLLDQGRVIRIDNSGNRVSGWPAAGVPIAPAATFDIDVAPDSLGGAYFAWTTNDSVVVIRYDGSGAVSSGWPAAGLVVAQGVGFAEGVRIARIVGGDVMASWDDFRFFDIDLFAVRVGKGGSIPSPWVSGGIPVCTATGSVVDANIQSDVLGGAVIAWEDQRGGAGSSIYAQRVTSGAAISPGWPTNGAIMCPETPSKFPQAILADGTGGLFASWVDNISSGDMSDDVFLQHLTSSGSRPAGFPAAGLVVCDAAMDQESVSLATDGSGGAILCWEDNRSLVTATRVYVARVLGDGTVAAQASLASAIAEPGVVKLVWFSPDGADFSATLERERQGEGFTPIAELTADGGGYVRYEDRDVVAGATYRYRLVVIENGQRRALGEATLRVPDALSLAIEGARPNPGASPVTVAFTLPVSAPANLEILDVGGRRVVAREVNPTAGRQLLRIEERLVPGVYVVRLTQAGRAVTTRIVVTE